MIASRDGIRKRRAGAEDIEIGRKIRALRLERGLSQSGLAEGIGLTFQQVQKYEKGANRVSAGRLQQISNLLNVPITFFYSGMDTRTKKDAAPSGLAFLQTKGALRLIAPTRRSPRARRSMRWWCWRRFCGIRRGGDVESASISAVRSLFARIPADESLKRSLMGCTSVFVRHVIRMDEFVAEPRVFSWVKTRSTNQSSCNSWYSGCVGMMGGPTSDGTADTGQCRRGTRAPMRPHKSVANQFRHPSRSSNDARCRRSFALIRSLVGSGGKEPLYSSLASTFGPQPAGRLYASVDPRMKLGVRTCQCTADHRKAWRKTAQPLRSLVRGVGFVS